MCVPEFLRVFVECVYVPVTGVRCVWFVPYTSEFVCTSVCAPFLVVALCVFLCRWALGTVSAYDDVAERHCVRLDDKEEVMWDLHAIAPTGYPTYKFMRHSAVLFPGHQPSPADELPQVISVTVPGAAPAAPPPPSSSSDDSEEEEEGEQGGQPVLPNQAQQPPNPNHHLANQGNNNRPNRG